MQNNNGILSPKISVLYIFARQVSEQDMIQKFYRKFNEKIAAQLIMAFLHADNGHMLVKTDNGQGGITEKTRSMRQVFSVILLVNCSQTMFSNYISPVALF